MFTSSDKPISNEDLKVLEETFNFLDLDKLQEIRCKDSPVIALKHLLFPDKEKPFMWVAFPRKNELSLQHHNVYIIPLEDENIKYANEMVNSYYKSKKIFKWAGDISNYPKYKKYAIIGEIRNILPLSSTYTDSIYV